MNSVQRLLDSVVASGACTGGVRLTEIELVEQTFALRFPESYRQFLKTCGTMSRGHCQIHGLGVPVSDPLSVVWVLSSLRLASPNAPKGLIPIRVVGDDVLHCLLCNSSEAIEADSPVYLYDVRTSALQSPWISESFSGYLREIILEGALASVYSTNWSQEVAPLLFTPDGTGGFSLDDGYALLEASFREVDKLLPLALVDERSIACVVVDDGLAGLTNGDVVRVHLVDVPPEKQLRRLDVDPLLYVQSLEEELAARPEGLQRVLDYIGPAYEQTYIEHEKRPRDFVVRPVRIACQNVIVALAAIAQDSAFDGLSVVAWQTCEVPHVATHEANRALAALTLADAFQNGGTMEIRFDRKARVVVEGRTVEFDGHPEKQVPASLRRFGRTVGVNLGAEDPAAISPAEARALFLAITPMPSDLRTRVSEAVEMRGITPERLCFTLLSQIWREIELDFMLACSERAGSILSGGADWRERSARQVEMSVARAAIMAGMLYRRLNGRDAAGSTDGVRVVEDVSVGVKWQVRQDLGAVEFRGFEKTLEVPWTRGIDIPPDGKLLVFFRTHVSQEVAEQANQLQAGGAAVAVAVPHDAEVPHGRLMVPLLRCPDRIADLDKVAEARLLTSRISRA